MSERTWLRILKDVALAAVIGNVSFWALLSWPIAKSLSGPIGWFWLLAALVLAIWIGFAGMLLSRRRGWAPW
jgi:hypothetical protein